MNTNAFENIIPLAVNPAAFLAAFHGGPYGLRSFADRPEGRGGRGCNRTVTAAQLADQDGALLAALRAENDGEQRGIFFVVNPGGHKDAEITAVAAQFVEADDLPLAEQWDNLMAFPLAPSIIVRTRKSLHGYWLLALPEDERATPDQTAPDLARFTPLKKQLAAHFSGDPVIANLSRVMRLPGFDHHKGEPVAVRCLLFEPQRRYRQTELAAVLCELHPDDPCFGGRGVAGKKASTTTVTTATTSAKNRSAVALDLPRGDFDLEQLLSTCDFIRHCQEQAATLPEPLWYPMITNLADVPGGEAAIHQLSAAHPGYSFAATVAKIEQFRRSNTGPFSCETIAAWGFNCPQLGRCSARQPRDRGQIPPPPWYRQTRTGLRLIPGVLANALAAHKNIFYSRQCYYQYLDGVYKKVEELHCKHIVRKYLRTDDVEMHQINDVIGQWTMEILRSPENLNVNKELINLKNGLYQRSTRTLKPHDPQLLSTIQLAVSYDPQAAAPIFAAFLNDCLDPETQLLVQELCGYLLVPVTRAQKAFVLVGEGGAGKSTLLSVIQELLLGAANVSNISWQNLGETFLTAELDGRLANIFADLPSKNIDDSSLFKSITGEDWLTAQRKNKDPHGFKSTARLVFSCNSIPKNLGDRSEAFYRRLVIIPFGPPKPPQQRDLHLKEKLAREAPGILNWALVGLTRLDHNGYRFSTSAASQTALESYRVAGSSVLSFVSDCCVVETERQVSAAQLYHAYQQYSGSSGLRPVSQKRFWMELKESFGMVEKTKDSLSRRAIYHGVDLENFEDLA
nr:phage/plasmid primase, P4 family [uncultured Acetobacterium sp.]